MEDISDEFNDPITFELMTDPVIASDEKTYDRATFNELIQSTGLSPFSREPLSLDCTEAKDLRDRAVHHMISLVQASFFKRVTEEKSKLDKSNELQVLIKALTARTWAFQLSPDNTVFFLKYLICEKTTNDIIQAIKMYHSTALVNRRQLTDEHTLSEEGVINNETFTQCLT